MESGEQSVAATGTIMVQRSYVDSLHLVKKVHQNTYHFPNWALFLFTGVKCVVVAMKKIYCYVKKTSGKMEYVLKTRQLLLHVALP